MVINVCNGGKRIEHLLESLDDLIEKEMDSELETDNDMEDSGCVKRNQK